MIQCKQIAYIFSIAALFVACDSKGLRGAKCRATSDCSNGLFCDNGTCKSCPAGLMGCGSLSTSCSSSSDCGLGKVCFQAQCFSSCGGDAECDVGLVCTDKRCVPGCRADTECDAKEICEQKTCTAGCRTDSACEAKQICEALTCVTGCRNDGACEPRQVCDNKVCNTGCRNDAACTVGSELCVSGQCVALEEAMKPTITFTPPQARAYVGENVVLSTVVSVAPGPLDTAPPVVTFENVNTGISVSGFNFTLNSTAVAGAYAFTVKAVGRGGTRTATFQFEVLTDAIYGYVVPVNPSPTTGEPTAPGVWRIQSDGTGFSVLDAEDNGELMKRGIEYGFVNRLGASPAYSVGVNAVGSEGYGLDYELHTSSSDRWLRTTGITEQGICAPGVRAASGALGGTGAKTCIYPITNMSSDGAGRRVAFMITKADLGSRQINPIGDTIIGAGAVMVLDTAMAAPASPIVLGNALNHSPTNPQTAIPGVTVFSRLPERTLSTPGDVAGTARDQLAGPSISADGTRLAVTHGVLSACPTGGDCGDNYTCNNTPTANAVCERNFCQNDTQCDACERRTVCANDAACSGIVDLNGSNTTEGARCETYTGGVKLCRAASLACAGATVAGDQQCATTYAMNDPNLAMGGNLCQDNGNGIFACFCVNNADCGTGRTCVAVLGSVSGKKICAGPSPTVRVIGSETYTCHGPSYGGGAGAIASACDGCRTRTTCACRPNPGTCDGATEQTFGSLCCNFRSCTGGAGCAPVDGTSSDYACACEPHETARTQVSRGKGVPVCCSSGRCEPGACESNTDCVTGQTCNDNKCVPAPAEQRLEIYDTTQPSAPLVSGPNMIVPTLEEGAPGFVMPLLYPMLIGTDRVAFFTIPFLSTISGAISGTGSISPSTRLFEVRLTTSALDPAASTLISPRSLGGISDAGLLGMSFTQGPEATTTLQECLDNCASADNSLCECPSNTEPACVDGTLSCCKAECWNTCNTAVSSLMAPFGKTGPTGSEQDVFTLACQDIVSSGASSIGSSMPIWMARDNTGQRLLIVEQSSVVGIAGFTGGSCTKTGLSSRFCGPPAPSGGPTSAWNAYVAPMTPLPTERTRLVLHDTMSDSSFDLLDTAAFNTFLAAQDTFEIGDPHMISEGRQVAFVARGAAIKPPPTGGPANADDPSIFVVNTDGTNPRRILDRTRAVSVTVPGYGGIFSCASCTSCESPTLCNPDDPGACSATSSPEAQLQQIGAQWFALFLVSGIVRRWMRLSRKRR